MSKRINTKSWRVKDGRPIHDGDCSFWGKEICTCGLIHHLMPDFPEEKWYGEERGKHETQVDRVPKPLQPPTKEEMRQRLKEANIILKEVFGEDATLLEEEEDDVS